MQNRNSVVFKGNKDGITILLDEEASFESIKETLIKKVVDAKKFFGGAKTSIYVRGKVLSEEEEAELLNIIAEKANLDISFVYNDIYKAVEVPSDNMNSIASYTSKLYLPEHVTKFHRGSLRSGQSIRFNGSIIVVGDVNPGAEVICTGNIVVLGSVKGLVHAGSSGNTDCFIAALSLMPTQLRIAQIISFIPVERIKIKKKKDKNVHPSYAYIKDGQIYISPLTN